MCLSEELLHPPFWEGGGGKTVRAWNYFGIIFLVVDERLKTRFSSRPADPLDDILPNPPSAGDDDDGGDGVMRAICDIHQ